MKNKGLGFYCTIIAAILLLVGLITYGGSYVTVSVVYTFLGIALAIAVIGIVASFFLKAGEILNWIPVACAIFTALAIFNSINPMLDAVGYVVSGLYVFSDIQGWVIFMVVTVVAMIVTWIGGFAKINK